MKNTRFQHGEDTWPFGAGNHKDRNARSPRKRTGQKHPEPSSQPKNKYERYFNMPAVKEAFFFLLSDRGRNLTPSDKLVLWHIARRAGKYDASCYPSVRSLAEDAGLSRPTVEASIKRLQQKNVIKVASGRDSGRSNVYTLTFYTPKAEESVTSEEINDCETYQEEDE